MKASYSTGFFDLLRRSLASLFLFGILLGTGFLILGWLFGSLQTPAWLPWAVSGHVPTRLTIDVQPADSTILLNDKRYDPNRAPLPGQYTVRVTRQGYQPANETIVVHPEAENYLAIRLMPSVTVAEVAANATLPGWDEAGNLYFLDDSGEKIHQWSGGQVSEGVPAPGGVYDLLYAADGEMALALSIPGPDSPPSLSRVDLNTGSTTELPPAFLVASSPDARVFWGLSPDSADPARISLWRLDQAGSPSPVPSARLPGSGHQLIVDPGGLWIAVGSLEGVHVYEIASGEVLAEFGGASHPVWVAGTRPGLAFLDKRGSLCFAAAGAGWAPVALLPNVEAPIAVLPGSSEVVFSRFNPAAGGASLWALDTLTQGLRLLSEAKIESGRAEQLAASPDGKKIAIVNQLNTLYVVILEP